MSAERDGDENELLDTTQADLEAWVDYALNTDPVAGAKVADGLRGTALLLLVAMRRSRGRANPKVIVEMIRDRAWQRWGKP